MSTHGPVCAPDRHSLTARWLLGEPLAGERKTDATFWRRGRHVTRPDANPHAWSYLPGWERAAIRFAVLAIATGYAVGLVLAGPIAHAFIGTPALAAGAWWARRMKRQTVLRRHHRAVAVPLERALRRYVDELPRDAVSVPLTYAEDESTPATIDLPPTFAGSRDPHAELVVNIATGKLGLDGRAVVRWDAAGGECRLTVGVTAQPPRSAGLGDVRDAMSTAPDTRPVLGISAREVVHADYHDDSPHVLISAGSGAGKSVLIRNLAAQALHTGAVVVVLDVKMLSHTWLRGLPGVHYARSAEAIHHTLIALADEGMRRYATAADTADLALDPDSDDVPDDADIDAPRVIVVCEELNATLGKLQAWWDHTRERGTKRQSPAVAALSEILAMGRQARMHVIGCAQYATASSTGGPTGRENFGTRCLARATRNAWRMLAPQIQPVPAASRIVGRWHVVTGDSAVEVQVPFLSPREARSWARSGELYDGPDILAGSSVPSDSPGRVQGINSSNVPARGHSLTLSEATGHSTRRYTLAEASESGIVPLGYEALRKARQRDPEFPAGLDIGGVTTFTADELTRWHGNRPRTRSEVTS